MMIDQLISELSNLSVRERNNRIGGIAAKVRKTPRLRPIDPKHAGRGYSITPRGREFRAAQDAGRSHLCDHWCIRAART